MTDVRIKICGVTRAEDVETCLELGVEWIGFNFWPKSKRYISPDAAAELVRRLPAPTHAIGVFVNSPAEEIAQILDRVPLSAIQLHGDERLEDYAHLPARLIQVLRISGPESLEKGALSSCADEVLLDAAVAGYGGAGQRFDWTLASAAQRTFDRKVMLAGGLTPENVAQAVRDVAPAGVDCASGVESAPGVKDPQKLKAFVHAVRGAAGGTA